MPSSDASQEKPPVIAHVLHRLYRAGAEVLAADLSRKLGVNNSGCGDYRFLFICLDDTGPMGEELIEEGFTVLNMKRQGGGIDKAVAKRIAEAVAEHGIDLLHAHQYTPFFYAALSRGLFGKQPPVIFTEHGRHYPDTRKLKRVMGNKVLLKKSDRVTAVGEHVKKLVALNEGIPAKRIDVILNGIDPEAFKVDPAARGDVRGELGLSDDATVFLQVARFHPVKDHGTAVRAFAEATKDTPNAMLLLAGAGDEQANIEAIVDELGVRDKVRFLGVRSDIGRLIGAADIFVLSSLSEGISVTLLEAMAGSLPIIATGVAGNPEVVEHDVTGLLSPRSDAPAMAANMQRLARDADLRKQMGDAGHARLHRLFTQQHMHEQYAKLYRQMLSNPG